MKDSEKLSAFLDFLRSSDEELYIACSIQRDMDQATQDILHHIEMQENTQHEFILEGIALKDIRQKRRNAKDREKILSPVVEWYAANQRVVNDLQRLLGKIRKEEKSIENRTYTNRTEVVRMILQEGED